MEYVTLINDFEEIFNPGVYALRLYQNNVFEIERQETGLYRVNVKTIGLERSWSYVTAEKKVSGHLIVRNWKTLFDVKKSLWSFSKTGAYGIPKINTNKEKTYSMKTFMTVFGMILPVEEMPDSERTGDYYFQHDDKFYKHAAMFPGKNIKEVEQDEVPKRVLDKLHTQQWAASMKSAQESKSTDAMTELLNLKCSRTDMPIKPGELVMLHNWGTDDSPIGFGRFVWDKDARSFTLEPDYELDRQHGFVRFDIDPYDMFRTSPEKVLLDMSGSTSKSKNK